MTRVILVALLIMLIARAFWRVMDGVIEAATIVTAAFENLPPPPYAIAYVRLEGVSTSMINFVQGLDLTDVAAAMARLKPGTPVRVEFVENPEGRVTDFHYIVKSVP